MARERRFFRLRRPPPPPPEPPISEEFVEEYEVPPPPGPPAPVPPWFRGLWFWLALLAAAVLIGLVILLATELDDDQPGTRTATIATVPDVEGLSRDEAGAALADAGYGVSIAFEPDPAPKGEVLRQEPEAGAALEVGERVLLIVSAGPGP
jgi:hypothetical protein